MERSKERLEAHLKLLGKAEKTLSQALRLPLTDVVRDAAIQRFEYVFELSWKTIWVAAVYVGSSCNSPREAIKTAFRMKWIKNPDRWLEAMEARNRTSHTYDEAIARQVYRVAKKFPLLVHELSTSLKNL